jgi:hypothetical protein
VEEKVGKQGEPSTFDLDQGGEGLECGRNCELRKCGDGSDAPTRGGAEGSAPPSSHPTLSPTLHSVCHPIPSVIRQRGVGRFRASHHLFFPSTCTCDSAEYRSLFDKQQIAPCTFARLLLAARLRRPQRKQSESVPGSSPLPPVHPTTFVAVFAASETLPLEKKHSCLFFPPFLTKFPTPNQMEQQQPACRREAGRRWMTHQGSKRAGKRAGGSKHSRIR